jgi:hypothetical protein
MAGNKLYLLLRRFNPGKIDPFHRITLYYSMIRRALSGFFKRKYNNFNFKELWRRASLRIAETYKKKGKMNYFMKQ